MSKSHELWHISTFCSSYFTLLILYSQFFFFKADGRMSEFPKNPHFNGTVSSLPMPAVRYTGHSLSSVHHKHPLDRHAYVEKYKHQMHLEMFCNTAELLEIKGQLAQTARKILTAHTKRQRKNSGKGSFIIKNNLFTFYLFAVSWRVFSCI